MRSIVALWDRAQMRSIVAFWTRAQARSIFVSVRKCDRSHSGAIDRTNRDQLLFRLFPPFKPHFHANDLQHNETLKVKKLLENNKVKSLTNIN
jgi:hypothetical protein